jgi:hypothetical protein
MENKIKMKIDFTFPTKLFVLPAKQGDTYGSLFRFNLFKSFSSVKETCNKRFYFDGRADR